MIQIANIVGDYKRVYNNTNFDIELLSNNDKIVEGLPNLLIGYDSILKLNPNQDILEKKYTNGLYWTFSTSEKIDDFYRDIDWFIMNIFKIYEELYSFEIIDPIFYKNFNEKNLSDIISKLDIKNVIVLNKKIYIKTIKTIYCISFELLSFFNINQNMVLETIEKTQEIKIIKKSDFDKYKEYFKDLTLFERYYICYQEE
jgi:ABC-type antimicrobial peptide transport system permease subunit